MTDINFTKEGTLWKSDVITDKIQALQINFADDNRKGNEVTIARSLDGNVFQTEMIVKTDNSTFIINIDNDIEEVAKVIYCAKEPTKAYYI